MRQETGNGRFHLFGGLRLELDGAPLMGRAAQKKRLALLAVLAASHPRGVAREVLATMLWSEGDPDRIRRRVSSTLYELRSALGPVIVESGEEVRYDPEALPCDVVEFERALAGDDPAAAVAAYAGAFLAGLHVERADGFERWATEQRDRFARRFAAALETVAETREAKGDAVGAAEAWQRLAEHDPYSARVAMRTMRALAAAGDRAGAVLHGETYVDRLGADLELEPEAEPLALIKTLREAPPPGVPGLVMEPVRRPATASPPRPIGNDDHDPEPEHRGVPAASGSGRSRAGWRPWMAPLVLLAAAAGGYPLLNGSFSRSADLAPDRVLVLDLQTSSDDPALRHLLDRAAAGIAEGLRRATDLDVVRETPSPEIPHTEAGTAAESAAMGAAAGIGAATLVRAEARGVASGYALAAEITDVAGGSDAYRVGPIHVPAADADAALDRLRDEVAGAVAFRLDPRFSDFPRSRQSPSTLPVYTALATGVEYLKRFQAHHALAEFRSAAALDSTFLVAHLLALEALERLGRERPALLAETEALAARRGEMDPWERRILDYYAAVATPSARGVGNLTFAYAAARDAADLAPGPFTWWLHGHTAVRKLRLEEAAEVLERIDPRHPWALALPHYFWILGDVYHYLGRYEDELRLTRERRAVADHSLLARNELRARVALGDVEAVLGEVEEDVTSGTAGHHAAFFLRTIPGELARHGFPDLALGLRHRLLDWYDALPPDKKAHRHNKWTLGVTLLKLGRYEAAMDPLRCAADRSPHVWSYLGAAGAGAAALGLTHEVEDIRQRIRERMDPSDAVSGGWYALAGIAAMEGDHDQAAYLVERARATHAMGLTVVNFVHQSHIFDDVLVDHPTLGFLVAADPER